MRKAGSPAVMPYCSAGRPVLGERRTWFSAARVSATGSEALSVKPAASEMSLGRDSAACMSHEMGGSVVRRPICGQGGISFENNLNINSNIRT